MALAYTRRQILNWSRDRFSQAMDMNIYSNILDMVGRTPMLEVRNLDTGPCRLFLKLELMNPGGSVKDRIGISMIEEAEKRGDIKPGDTLVEATARSPHFASDCAPS